MTELIINEAILARACDDLGLKNQNRLRIFVEPVSSWSPPPNEPRRKAPYAYWTPSGQIILYTGHDLKDRASVVHASIAYTRSLLHELRHEWQSQNGKLRHERPGSYWNEWIEVDARDWADRNIVKYRGLVKVKRTLNPRTPFARLSAAERSAK